MFWGNNLHAAQSCASFSSGWLPLCPAPRTSNIGLQGLCHSESPMGSWAQCFQISL